MKVSMLAGGLVVALVLSGALARAQPGSHPSLSADWTRAIEVLAGADEARAHREGASSDDPGCFGFDGIGSSERAARARSLAPQWRGRPVTWAIEGDHARGLLGPPMPAMTTVCMRLERGAWRFAGFIPGD